MGLTGPNNRENTMSNNENTVNRTIDGDSAEGHIKHPQSGDAEVHQRQLDDDADGHIKHRQLDDEAEGHSKARKDSNRRY
jgi:hypothetical protein